MVQASFVGWDGVTSSSDEEHPCGTLEDLFIGVGGIQAGDLLINHKNAPGSWNGGADVVWRIADGTETTEDVFNLLAALMVFRPDPGYGFSFAGLRTFENEGGGETEADLTVTGDAGDLLRVQSWYALVEGGGTTGPARPDDSDHSWGYSVSAANVSPLSRSCALQTGFPVVTWKARHYIFDMAYILGASSDTDGSVSVADGVGTSTSLFAWEYTFATVPVAGQGGSGWGLLCAG